MHKYTVEFRVDGIALIPSEVTALLGLQPCQVREAGIDGARKNGGKSLWAYDGFGLGTNSKHEWESLESGLLFLLEKLLPKKNQIELNFSNFDILVVRTFSTKF